MRSVFCFEEEFCIRRRVRLVNMFRGDWVLKLSFCVDVVVEGII